MIGTAERKAFHFDPHKCTGCQACELACSIENELEGFSWRQVVTLNEARHPEVPVVHLSLACNHCADAPCMEHCPALAYSRDPATGRVNLDADRCIGCRYCSWACPYDAPRFDEAQGVMTKCTFCGHRQAQGLEPACVEQCPTGALGFGDLADLEGVPEALGMPTLEPQPSIRFAASRDEPRATACGGAGTAPSELRKISLREEWPLAVFSLIMAGLVAAFTAAAAGGVKLAAPWFLGAAAVGMGLSTLHLGKPVRAWRAMLNLRGSWLSREILTVSVFVGCGGLTLLLPESSPGLAAATIAVGFVALFAIDRVYDLVRAPIARPLHSADVLLTGLLWSAILLEAPWAALAVGALKLVLYLRRKLAQPGNLAKSVSVSRLATGFAVPLIGAAVSPALWQIWAMLGSAIGESIDRCELYGELVVPTPRGQMQLELAARLRESKMRVLA